MKLENLVKECLERGLEVTGVGLRGNGLGYRIGGFGKSGDAILYEKNSKIYAETRYDTINEIDSFNDLAWVAYEWHNISNRVGLEVDKTWLLIIDEEVFGIRR